MRNHIILATIAVVALACSAQTPPSPSPTTAATSTTAGPTATPSPAAASPASPTQTGLLNDRYGWIVTGPAAGGTSSEVWIRAETDPQKRSVLVGGMFTPSPDGTQVAQWRSGARGEFSELFILPAADPSQGRVVYQLESGQRGIQIVWANDGSGILFTHGGVSAKTQSLVLVDLRRSNASTTLGTLTDGRTYVPIAWDRSADLVAAAESTVDTGGPAAPNVESYLRIRPGAGPAIDRVRVSERMPTPRVQGSPDGKYAFGFTADGLRAWPTNDYGAGVTFQLAGGTGAVRWRPGTAQIIWLNQQELQVEAYDVATKTGSVLFRGVTRNAAFGTDLTGVRFDGSAAIVGASGGTNVRTLVDLRSGATAPLEMGTAFGAIGSVRLR